MATGHSSMAAASEASAYFQRRFPNAMCGIIAIDPTGRPGFAQTAPKMTCGWVNAHGAIVSKTA